MSKHIKVLLDIFIILIITFILIEIFTRVFIKKIPINIIYHFNQEIRTEVILKLGLISKKDFNEIKAKAEAGNAEAQLQLAKMYGEGRGIRQDLNEFMNWIRKSAEQKNPKAQFQLALKLRKGI